MNWISRLERKYGRFCIPNLISVIVGGQILVYAIELFVNQFMKYKRRFLEKSNPDI